MKAQPGCDGYSNDVLIEAAQVASDLLYRLSGRLWTGACGPVTVRPLCRPSDSDDQGWGGFNMGMGITAWGMCGGITRGGNIASHYGHSDPREVDLGAFPITEIVSVLINGETIPSDEYQLNDYRTLARMLPSLEATPTQYYGWPTAQRLDLPDTEQGTFSVTYMYGSPPPPSGVRAAKALAENFAKSFSGDSNQLPTRITALSRQGVSAAITDVEDIISKGMTGIYQVDIFLNAVNPGGQRTKTLVWSPDRGRARRLPRGVS